MFTIGLKGMHMDITPAIRSYTEEKVRMLERLVDADEQIFVEIELGKTTEHHQRGDVFRAEITMKTPHGSHRAEAEKEDLYAAIDVAKDDLAGELKKDKAKRETSIKKGGRMFKDLMQKMGFGE
jgi:putative sigma-54 modulation protein